MVQPGQQLPRRRDGSPEQRLRWLISIMALTVLGGAVGYKLLEGGSWLDAIYMTVITVATVGFRELYELSATGKVFTMILIVFSIVILAYTIGTLGQFLVEGQLRDILGKRKMEKQIKRMKDHFIIVGYGRVGQMVHEEFVKHKIPCVIVENDQEMLEILTRNEAAVVQGSAIEDEVLIDAGILNARALINTIPHEADAVYICLTARQLNPNIRITARADSKLMEKKLVRAGANRVVSPHEIGGRRMAMACLRPNVVDFMTIAGLDTRLGLSIEEIKVGDDSIIAGQALKDTELRAKFGVTVIGIKKASGSLDLNPAGEVRIEGGDTLILLGASEALERLEGVSVGT